MTGNVRTLLSELYDAAVSAAHPATCLPPHLPLPPGNGRLIVLAVGKAAAAMAVTAEGHYRALGMLDRLEGLATAPHGYAATLSAKPERLEVLEARHPTPDEVQSSGS